MHYWHEIEAPTTSTPPQIVAPSQTTGSNVASSHETCNHRRPHTSPHSQITHVLALLCEVSPSSLCAIWKSARSLLWLQVPSHVSCALIKSDCRLFSSQNQGLWPSFTVYSCWFVSSVLLSTLLLVPVFPPLPYVSPLQLSGEVISPAHLSVIAVAKSFKALGDLLHTFSTRKSVILASQPSELNFWVLTSDKAG